MIRACLRALLLSMAYAVSAEAMSLEQVSRQFLDSEFVFSRTQSDVPFVPLAWLDVNSYRDTTYRTPSGEVGDLSFRQTSISEATLLPVLLGRRDALVIGQWGTWTRLESTQSQDETSVANISLPLGWARQASPDWQLAAFVAPSANHSGGHWYWDYMGGVFARYLGKPHFAWLFGFYGEVTAPEELYVPYVGVTWTIDRHWTLSAVLPWPAVLYAPTPDWLLRFGLAPSSASWITETSVQGNAPQRFRADLTSWDLGFRVERRAWKSLWVGGEAGVSGFRGFAFSSGKGWQDPKGSLGSDPYLVLTMTFRPSLASAE
jgi:hypothetical protein